MRVLLVGANGFLGRNVGQMLMADGHDVIALVRAGARANSWTGQIVAESVVAIETLRFDQLGIDAVVNVAAAGVDPKSRDPALLVDTNVALPVILAGVAARIGARAFLHVGSSAEYAEVETGRLIDEDSSLDARRLYGATKAAGTLAFTAAALQHQLPAAVLRPFNLFGAGEASHRLFPALITRLSRGDEAALSAGTQMRDFVSVREASRALILMLEALLEDASVAGTYNLCTGRPMSVADFARTVATALGARLELLNFGAIPMRPDDLKWVVGSPKKLAETIGWRFSDDIESEIAAACRAELSTEKAGTE